MFRTLIMLGLLAMATAFAPIARPSTGVAALRMAYVPDGISAKDYENMKKKEQSAMDKNRKKFKNKSFETLDEWNIRRTKANPNKPGAGHRFVKLKYEMDNEDNFTRNKPRASDGL